MENSAMEFEYYLHLANNRNKITHLDKMKRRSFKTLAIAQASIAHINWVQINGIPNLNDEIVAISTGTDNIWIAFGSDRAPILQPS